MSELRSWKFVSNHLEGVFVWYWNYNHGYRSSKKGTRRKLFVTQLPSEQWVVRERRLQHKLESNRGGPGRDYLLIFISFLVQTERWEQKKGKMIRKESNK